MVSYPPVAEEMNERLFFRPEYRNPMLVRLLPKEKYREMQNKFWPEFRLLFAKLLSGLTFSLELHPKISEDQISEKLWALSDRQNLL